MPEDPKKLLTKFLTEFDEEFPDLNTEYATPDGLRLIRVYRLLGEDYNFKFFTREANRIAKIMWSWKRQSRIEATQAMRDIKQKKGFVEVGLEGEEEEPPSPAPE